MIIAPCFSPFLSNCISNGVIEKDLKLEDGIEMNGRSCKKKDSYKYQDDDDEIDKLLDDDTKSENENYEKPC